MSGEEILSDYEDLEPDDILAALAFAACVSRVKQVREGTCQHGNGPRIPTWAGSRATTG